MVGHDARMTTQTETAVEVRALAPDEFRAASTVFRASLHHGPATDEAWTERGRSYEEGRVLGAFRADTLIGTALSYSGSRMLLPGGQTLPMAMVTGVGVRADQTRRGALTALMRAQLTGVPEPLATLRASEAAIYGRFGYGVATRGRTVEVDRHRAVFRPGTEATGSVRIMPKDEAWDVAPALFDRIPGRRPGWIARPRSYWQAIRMWKSEAKAPSYLAVHTGPDGDDGYAWYHVGGGRDGKSMVHIDDMAVDRPEAWVALWRFLMSVDLVDGVRAEYRPLDEPIEELFTDRRRVDSVKQDDETWLRLIDVPTALAERAFGDFATADGSVVIEVRDAFLPANSGRYRIGDGPARRVAEPAELSMDVDTLAELYLGDSAPSTLAYAGRVAVTKADALSVADRLFATDCSPWCGTFF